MELDPLRIGISGSGVTANGVAFQVSATDGMEVAWHCKNDPSDLLKIDPVDVFVEASGQVALATTSALLAIENHAHVILTDPRVDTAFGLLLQSAAYQQGIIVTSDAGTPHGALASLIQEAHIMGFQPLLAGQISPSSNLSQIAFEQAALANGFGFLPPPTGMTAPELTDLNDALTSFDLSTCSETPQVDYLQGPNPANSLFLIIQPRNKLPAEQLDHLRSSQLAQSGDAPYLLLKRPPPLGHFETPKAILGAAAGQPVLTPGFPTCDVYAEIIDDSGNIKATLLPFNEDLIPFILLEEKIAPKYPLKPGQLITFDDLDLPDSPLLHLWVDQRKIIESYP